jgi:hypothetical protein
MAVVGWSKEALLEPSKGPKEYSRKEVKEGARSKITQLIERIAQDRGYTMRPENRPQIKRE